MQVAVQGPPDEAFENAGIIMDKIRITIGKCMN